MKVFVKIKKTIDFERAAPYALSMSRFSLDRVHVQALTEQRFVQPALLFPFEYLMFVTVSAMDIVLTWVILQSGGSELNPIANLVIEHHGLNGMVAYKFALVVLVVVLCESVGRAQVIKGRLLAWFCVLLTTAVVTWSLSLVLLHLF